MEEKNETKTKLHWHSFNLNLQRIILNKEYEKVQNFLINFAKMTSFSEASFKQFNLLRDFWKTPIQASLDGNFYCTHQLERLINLYWLPWKLWKQLLRFQNSMGCLFWLDTSLITLMVSSNKQPKLQLCYN